MCHLLTGIRSKYLERHGNNQYRVGVASMLGRRESMEDRHVVKLGMEHHPSISYFAVFDGHGGFATSNYLRSTLHERIDAMDNPTSDTAALCRVFEDLDADYMQTGRGSGSTACVVLSEPISNSIMENGQNMVRLTICNVGDSRCTVYLKDGTVVFTTVDHKPTTPSEMDRIVRAGGRVVCGRVDGSLALSRAFGDALYKWNRDVPLTQQKVVSTPTITQLTVPADDHRILVACDGIYECLSNQQVAYILGSSTLHDVARYANGPDPMQSLIYLLDRSLVSGSFDNMTAILIESSDGSAYGPTSVYLPAVCTSAQLADSVYMAEYAYDAELNGVDEEQIKALVGTKAVSEIGKQHGISELLSVAYASSSTDIGDTSISVSSSAVEPRSAGAIAEDEVYNDWGQENE